MRDIHRNPHIRKMKPITQPNERQRDDMMRHQLLKILPRLLQHQHQHNSLLRPVTRLQQVIRLKNRLMRAVRKPLVHARRVEIPHGAAAHDPDAEGPVDPKVQRGVGLLHEAGLLRAPADAEGNGHGADQALHAEFAREGEDDDVEGDEGEVARAFAVVCGGVGVEADGFCDEGVVGIEGIGEEERGGEGVRWVGVDEVGEDGGEHQEEGEQPCVSDAGAFEFREGAAGGAAFGAAGLVGFLGEDVSRRWLYVHSIAALGFHAGGGGAAADAAGSVTYRLDGALHVDRVQPSARPKRGHVDVAR